MVPKGFAKKEPWAVIDFRIPLLSIYRGKLPLKNRHIFATKVNVFIASKVNEKYFGLFRSNHWD